MNDASQDGMVAKFNLVYVWALKQIKSFIS